MVVEAHASREQVTTKGRRGNSPDKSGIPFSFG